MTKLYEAKNNDYGDSVSETYDKFGIDSFLVRMYDKMSRLYSLTRPGVEQKVKDEKLTDTLRDLANYAIIAMMEIEYRKEEKAEEKDTHKPEPIILLEEENNYGKHFKNS